MAQSRTGIGVGGVALASLLNSRLGGSGRFSQGTTLRAEGDWTLVRIIWTKHRTRGFSLLELIAVMVIVALVLCLSVPALEKLKTAADFQNSTLAIANLLEQARVHAMSQNTHVFVGLAEFDLDQPEEAPPKPGVGRVMAIALAAPDGIRGYNVEQPKSTWSATRSASLVPISKLWKFEQLHLAASLGPPPDFGPMGTASGRQDVGRFYRIGHPECRSVTPINYAQGSNLYHFTKVINFDPQGVARIQYESNGEEIKKIMEIGLQLTHGNQLPPIPINPNLGSQSALQLDCLTGSVRLFRP